MTVKIKANEERKTKQLHGSVEVLSDDGCMAFFCTGEMGSDNILYCSGVAF